MKTRHAVLFVLLIMIILVTSTIAMSDDMTKVTANISSRNIRRESAKLTLPKENNKILATVALNKTKRVVVFNNMTLAELGDKLNRSMNGLLAGQGHYFAAKSLELGIDPYMALAISLHETGCEWTCSYLARTCYNIGGQKGYPGCGGGGDYKRFNSLKEGIDGFLYNLHGNYVKRGLTTPERINPVYAENPLWHQKVRHYMAKIASK